jgi:hypothetical protein
MFVYWSVGKFPLYVEANPKIVGYNTSIVKLNNSTNSIACF